MAPDNKYKILKDYVNKALVKYGNSLMLVLPENSYFQPEELELKDCKIIKPDVCVDSSNRDFFKQLICSIATQFSNIEGLDDYYEKTIDKERADIDFYAAKIIRRVISKYKNLFIYIAAFDINSEYIEDRDYNSLISILKIPHVQYFFTVSKLPKTSCSRGNELLSSMRVFDVTCDLKRFVDNNHTIFHISYCHKDSIVMERVKEELELRGYICVSDVKLGDYDDLDGFMKEIGSCDHAIMIISDDYLKRPNCMFELTQFFNQKNEDGRFFPVVVSKQINLFDAKQQESYYKYWKNVAEDIKFLIDELGDEYKINKLFDDKSKYIKYSQSAGKLFEILSKNIVHAFSSYPSFVDLSEFGDTLHDKLETSSHKDIKLTPNRDEISSLALEHGYTPER